MYYINTLKQEISTAKTYEHNLLEEKIVIGRHRCNMTAKFGVFIDEDHSKLHTLYWLPKIVSEYDQEIPQSQTADNPVAPRGRAAQPSQDTRKTN